MSKDKVFVNDPGTGPRKLSLNEFNQGYTGIALVMEPGNEFQRGGQKRNLIAAITSRLRSSRNILLFGLLAGIFLTLPRLLIPAFTQIYTDEILI